MNVLQINKEHQSTFAYKNKVINMNKSKFKIIRLRYYKLIKSLSSDEAFLVGLLKLLDVIAKMK
jgi:hypothetical protein